MLIKIDKLIDDSLLKINFDNIEFINCRIYDFARLIIFYIFIESDKASIQLTNFNGDNLNNRFY